jgi:hypothetical protein
METRARNRAYQARYRKEAQRAKALYAQVYYWSDPEVQRSKARDYYWRNRELVLARRRMAYRERRERIAERAA